VVCKWSRKRKSEASHTAAQMLLLLARGINNNAALADGIVVSARYRWCCCRCCPWWRHFWFLALHISVASVVTGKAAFALKGTSCKVALVVWLSAAESTLEVCEQQEGPECGRCIFVSSYFFATFCRRAKYISHGS